MLEIIKRLDSGSDLTDQECTFAAGQLPSPEVDPAIKKAFLVALHRKGETVAEVASFARVFRALASDPQLSDIAPDAIDIVGTGGSGSKGFNISSTTAFILAAAGVKVLKHGNRAITSQSGSADFLGQHGIRMDTDPALLRAAIDHLNFCFFFAPAFHPAFKEIMPVRMELAREGQRTVFNILGPLINPAKPAHQLLGVFSPDWVRPLADALHQLGLKRGVAVCSELPGGGYMDELTTAGKNHLRGFGDMADLDARWEPAQIGFPPASVDELRGGTAEENVALLDDMIRGNGRAGLTDTITLNAALAFQIAGRAANLNEGCALAREVLLGGRLKNWLKLAREFYQDNRSPE